MQKMKVCAQKTRILACKNMAMMGMGFQSVVTVPVNDQAPRWMLTRYKTMAQLKAEGKIIACVVATAGTTDAGRLTQF